MVVLDTSALLFWTLDPTKLTALASQTINQASQIIISSISIWEIGIKVKKGKLEIPLPIDQFAHQLQKVKDVNVVPVETETWLTNLALNWEHRDPADRTIVATAQILQAPLVTSDRAIRDYYQQAVW